MAEGAERRSLAWPAVAASIDVVVPAYNRWELTESCLRHLAAQTVEHRVIVVDDGSTDETRSRLRADWPQITALELGSTHGYTRAINRGVSLGENEYVVLLNNDVELRSDCLERLVTELQSDATIGSAAALMLAPGELGHETIDSLGVTADATLAGFARLQGRPASEAVSADSLLTGPEGTAGAYRRTAWEQVGGLDERIPAYMEDPRPRPAVASGWVADSRRTGRCGGAPGLEHLRPAIGRTTPARGLQPGLSVAPLREPRRRTAARALVTEAIVVTADALLCRDLQALRGRVEGWRAAHGCARRAWPPSAAIDESISLRQSLNLRRTAVRTPRRWRTPRPRRPAQIRRRMTMNSCSLPTSASIPKGRPRSMMA